MGWDAYTVPAREAGHRCAPWKLLGILALTKDGSRKKVKDIGERAKMAHHRRGWI